MNFKRIFVIFLGTAALGFVVTVGVTYLYSLIIYRAGVVDWGTAFRAAIIMGIVFTFLEEKKVIK